MPWKFLKQRNWLNLLGAVVLLIGLGSAALIYQKAGDRPNVVLGYEEGNGTVYPVEPEDSKEYLRGLELYGGKANVLADKLRRWFVGLGQGKSLAGLVGVMSIIVSCWCFYAAEHLPERPKGGVRSEDGG
jgi:hypothetical protein